MDKEKQMKYFSEKLNEVFDTPEALEEAEMSYDKARLTEHNKDVNNVLATKKTEIKVPSKKQLAADVEDAEAKLKEARADYDVATQKVEELSRKYLEEVDAILTPVKEAVTAAEQRRYEAIRKFNEAYGAYQVTLTGDRAAQEMLRTINELNKIPKDIFRNPFWF